MHDLAGMMWCGSHAPLLGICRSSPKAMVYKVVIPTSQLGNFVLICI